jgi:hypothetical protein
MTGPGGWKDGITVVTTHSAGVSRTEDFSVEMDDTLLGIALSNGVQIVAGKYTVTIYCTDELGFTRYGLFTAPLWFTDSTHYQATDPNTSQSPTQTLLTITPENRADLGSKVTVTAAVTPATATGTIQFRNRQGETFGKVGVPVTLSGGKATYSSTKLAFALYQFSAVFTPSDAKKLAPSTSPEVLFVVALPIPPIPTSGATLSGRAAVGQTLTCAATFKNAKSRSYVWLRDRVALDATASTYRLTGADRGHKIRCRALATNAGGTTSRTSAPVKVSK